MAHKNTQVCFNRDKIRDKKFALLILQDETVIGKYLKHGYLIYVEVEVVVSEKYIMY